MPTAPNAAYQTVVGTLSPEAVTFFVLFVLSTLGITWWAAKRTRTTKEFYAAGRSITGFQNGLALAGDYMSAASFLGIAGIVATKGYDGLIYSVGWLVGWPIVMFLIVKAYNRMLGPKATTTKACPFCKTDISIDATPS